MKPTPKPTQTVSLLVEIPAYGGPWGRTPTHKLTVHDDGQVDIVAPCGESYGHIYLRDLKAAMKALELTAKEKKELGLT